MTDLHQTAAPCAGSARAWRPRLATATAVVAMAASLFLLWQVSGSLFLIFAGLLFAVFLDACARALGRIWRAPRAWRLGVVCLLLVSATATGVSLGGYTAVRQADDLFTTVERQLAALRGQFRSAPAPAPPVSREGPGQAASGGGGSQDAGGETGMGPVLRTFFPNAGALLQSATTALGGLASGLGNAVVIFFLGLYVAMDPATYRNGALLLAPAGHRARIGSALDEAAETLRWWVGGQLASMAIIAALTYAALLLVGMPGALVLALLTGTLAFIPYIGSFVAGAVIVLAGLAQGPAMALWGAGVYLLVQLVESYVLAPIIQRWSVELPPALIIGGLTILGAFFGMWGFILAAPLLAVLRVVVLRFWVEPAERAA